MNRTLLSIKTLRELHAGWTQQYVADRIGVSRQTLTAWESLDTWRRLVPDECPVDA